jgi:hypothetical protein
VEVEVECEVEVAMRGSLIAVMTWAMHMIASMEEYKSNSILCAKMLYLEPV